MKKILSFFLAVACVVSLGTNPCQNVQAATKGTVSNLREKLVYKNNIYYIKDYEENAAICKFNTSTGKASKIITAKHGLSNMVIQNGIIYYSTYDDKYKAYTASVTVTGKQNKRISSGSIIYADSSYLVYDNSTTSKYRIYKMNLKTKKSVKISETKGPVSYIKNIGSTLYFWKYEASVRRVKLLSMKTSSKQMKLVTSDTCSKNEDFYTHYVSDVVKLNGKLYYQYGSVQGTGHFWNGIMKEINAKGKKKTISKTMIEETIYHDSDNLYYAKGVEETNSAIYNTKTGAKKDFKVTTKAKQAYFILGSRSLLTDWSNTSKVTVSTFTSGTNKKGLKKNVITFSYTQNKKYDYFVEAKKVGNFYLVSVQGTDFTNPNYGWRGRQVGITWFVADAKGKVVGNFK